MRTDRKARWVVGCALLLVAVLLTVGRPGTASAGVAVQPYRGGELEGTYNIGGRTGRWRARPTYVTSDAAETHAAAPGSNVSGLTHDGVALMQIARVDGTTVGCSGALLYDGWSVLTAAHCLTDANGTLAVNAVLTSWELSGGDVDAVAAEVHLHPQWNGQVTDGYDVAVINLTAPVETGVPRYDLFRAGGLAELDRETLKVGYGEGGFGETGVTGAAGTKRWGKNEWENDGLGDDGVAGIINDSAQLTYDFDSNYRNLTDDGGKDASDDATRDAFHVHLGEPTDLGFGDDEVLSSPGDSGGPSFVLDEGEFRIAGVSSYGLTLLEADGSDVDDVLNGTWGEFGIDARVAHPDIQTFIDESVIPEPGTLTLLAALLAGTWARCRR